MSVLRLLVVCFAALCLTIMLGAAILYPILAWIETRRQRRRR